MENEIKVHCEKLQELYYQNTKNELLANGQRTSMELSGAIAANGAIEVDVINRIRTLTAQIEYFTTQLQQL
jgi:hypothetical protein